MPGLQAVDSGHCSCRPEEKRTVKSREKSCTSLVGIWGQLRQIRTANTLEKTLMLGKIEGRRRKGRQMVRWLHSITDSMDRSLTKLWATVKDRKAWRAALYRVAESEMI